MPSAPDRRIDELYAAPLSEFVHRRNRLAGELREAGHQDEAARVKRLAKPSVPVWTINRLARQESAAVEHFIETVAQLRRAHVRSSGDVPEAMGRQRTALTALLRRAEEIMREAELQQSPALQRRLSDTLLGAAASRELQADLRRGRLAAEQSAPGFEVLEGARLRAIPGGRRNADAVVDRPATRTTETVPRAGRQDAGLRREEQPDTARRQRQLKADTRQKLRQARQLEQVVARRRKAADRAATQAQALRRKLQALMEQETAERAAADEAERQARRLRE